MTKSQKFKFDNFFFIYSKTLKQFCADFNYQPETERKYMFETFPDFPNSIKIVVSILHP